MITIEDKLAAGFRLATKEELMSVLWAPDNEAAEAAHRAAFLNADGWFWSSTPFPCDSDDAWVLCYDNGAIYNAYKSNGSRVRLVRAGQSVGTWQEGHALEERYSVSECGFFVTDRKTGLDWMQAAEDGIFSWDEAIAEFGGIDGRLAI